MTKKIFKLSGMHCAACSLNIEGALEDELGVRANANYAKQLVEVEWEETKVKEDQLVEVIETQGYKVV